MSHSGIKAKCCGGTVKNIAMHFIQFYIYAISYCIIALKDLFIRLGLDEGRPESIRMQKISTSIS